MTARRASEGPRAIAQQLSQRPIKSHTETTMLTGYLLCDDLMWMSRVMGEAKELGCKIIPARTVEQLTKAITVSGPMCVIIDLAQAQIGSDPTPIIDQLKAAGITRFVAYGSHVETVQLALARTAGCDPALARSKMAAQLANLLPEWLRS